MSASAPKLHLSADRLTDQAARLNSQSGITDVTTVNVGQEVNQNKGRNDAEIDFALSKSVDCLSRLWAQSLVICSA